MDPLSLLQELVSIPAPAGQEAGVRDALAEHLGRIGHPHRTDAKGNLLVGSELPNVVVTAHMDEIAMIVRSVEPDGTLKVSNLGGLFPWKLGEGPVQILSREPVDAVLSFGSIHTNDPASNVRRADSQAIGWESAKVVTGLSSETLASKGVRPGTRVVVHPSRRSLFSVGNLIGSYFLDDRADLVSWLLCLEDLDLPAGVLFAATAAEEVGGEGALYLLQQYRPDVCIALELGPNAFDAPVALSSAPSVWVTDSYSTMSHRDGELIAGLAAQLGVSLQYQALSRGGSDASCASSHGLCARHFTLGLPMENSHGFEVMHPGAIEELAKLTKALVQEILREAV